MTAAPPNDAASSQSDETVHSRNRLLRLPDVMARVGMKRSAIYQRMSEGKFPKSRSLGPKCAVWVEAEIEEWIRGVVQRSIDG